MFQVCSTTPPLGVFFWSNNVPLSLTRNTVASDVDFLFVVQIDLEIVQVAVVESGEFLAFSHVSGLLDRLVIIRFISLAFVG